MRFEEGCIVNRLDLVKEIVSKDESGKLRTVKRVGSNILKRVTVEGKVLLGNAMN